MSCLSGGGRPVYGLDIDILKSPSPSACSSSPSSTLSEASNSPDRISTKRARTPRKHPNQTYSEAAALLSTVYPKVFSTKNLGKLCKHTRSYDSYTESSELLPSFPALGDAGFLIGNPPDEKPIFRIEVKPVHSLKACRSDFPQPGSPAPLENDFEFDTESILDEEIEEGIDSIMGNLSMNNNGGSNEEPMNYNGHTNPLIRSLMSFGSGRKFELGFCFGLRGNLRRALRRVDDGEWWRTPTVSVQDIVPKFKALPSPSSSEKKKKKKKKVEKEEPKELPASVPQESSRTGLSLKLNYEEVLKEWSDRGSPFSDAELIGGSPESSTDLRARLAEIDLFPEMAGGSDAGGLRGASVMRYKEKRRSRLFSKKIRYQVRKVNADQRPRMKASGRFVKSPSLLKEAIEALKGGVREKVELVMEFGIHFADRKSDIHRNSAYVRAACEANLKRLDVDCINIYYQH